MLLSPAQLVIQSWLVNWSAVVHRSFLQNISVYYWCSIVNAMENRGTSTHMPKSKFSENVIAAAIEGFEAQKRRIDAQIAELRAMLPGSTTESPAAPNLTPGKGRKVSAAGRKRIAAAQRARWAASRTQAKPASKATPEPAQPKRRISAEGMKRIVAATKKRWRLAKAAKAQPAAAKKAAPTRKKGAAKKAAVKAPLTKAAKRSSAKRPKPKKAPAPAPTVAGSAV
jgi:hypothetical protein